MSKSKKLSIFTEKHVCDICGKVCANYLLYKKHVLDCKNSAFAHEELKKKLGF